MGKVIVVTGLDPADQVAAAAAAVAVACAGDAECRTRSVLLVDLRERPTKPRSGLLATALARELEARCRDLPKLAARARGHLCFAAATGTWEERLAGAFEASALAEVAIVVADPNQFRPAITAFSADRGLPGALVRADLGRDRALVGLLVEELHRAGGRVKVWTRRPGPVASRRAMAGLEPGGWVAQRAERARRALVGDLGQTTPLLLGAAIAVIALALILVAVGSGATAKARLQRSVDLAALSAAGSMREDFDRLFVPARGLDGSANPGYLSRGEYLERARDAAALAVRLNEAPVDGVEVSFPDADSFAPVRVSVELSAEVEDRRGGSARGKTLVAAEALVSPTQAPLLAGAGGCPSRATGGGYGGPLACRQGTPMRPDVAVAFDRMSAAASGAGITLLLNSGFRSDAEQAILFAANPDPRMVAPPGSSLHRCGTELDLGPEGAYGWLAGNAARFGFLQRYSCRSVGFPSITVKGLAGGRTRAQIGWSRPSRSS